MIVEAGEIGLSTRKLILETVGLNVVSVVSVPQAERLMKRHTIDAIIFDLDVEGAKPFLRDVRKNHGIPIFVLTTREWMPEEFKGIADAHFQKMQDPGSMVDDLVDELERTRQQQKTG